MRTTHRVFVVLLCLLAAVAVGVCVPKALAQSSYACDLLITLVYVHQTRDVISDRDALTALDEWELDESRYTEATGRPEYTLYGETIPARGGNRYLLVYASSVSDDDVVVFDYSYGRMFGDHDDPDLHNHPDCPSGTLPRADLEALLAATE